MNVQKKCSGTFLLKSGETTNGFTKYTPGRTFTRTSAVSSCCSPEQFKLYTGGTDWNMSEEPLVVVNTAVYVKQFIEMNQDAEEPVRNYQARLQ